MATTSETYRVNAFAKDFDLKSKDVTDMLAVLGMPGRIHSSVLSEEELSILLEALTQRNQIDITAYFKTFEDKKNAKKEEERKRLDAERAKRDEEKAKKKAEAAKARAAAGVPEQPQKKRSRDEVRVVDTRGTAGTTVDLAKYDEKHLTLDTGIPETAVTGKQKIKKKNKYAAPENNPQRGGMRPRDKQRPKQPMKIKPVQLCITVPDEISVGELASRMKKTAADVIKKLMMMGSMVSVNENVDYDTAFLVADEFGIKVTKEVVVTLEERVIDDSVDNDADLTERAPVVVVMGHVDHGKTSLLDAIRHSRVTEGEAGGITQHIGASRVTINDKEITFLDTPGHEAFTAMRARGANITDIGVLVVAADDGIMPQTVEAINHAKAAGISLIVAINKIDRPGADPERVKTELTQYELVPEEWGGDTICVPVSAHTGEGIDKLLDMILLSAEMLELKANSKRPASGVVIEAKLDKGRGAVATVLVQNGTLKNGDTIIAGTTVGRIRVMTDDKGNKVDTAGPSVPVEIMGLADVPQAGDKFNVVADERLAKELAEKRKQENKEASYTSSSKANLDDLFSQIESGTKTLNIIVKADVQGSAEAVKQSLLKLENEEVKVSVIHAGVGAVNEGDVMLANASNAIIIGFNIRPDRMALEAASRDKVDIRTYRIIYECIAEVEAAIKGMLAPKFKEVFLGRAEVRDAIHVPNVGTIAGCYVTDGKIARNALLRVLRDGVVITEDKVASLRRFKDDVKEVAQSFECGIGLDKFDDIKISDVLEAFIMEEIKQ